MYIQAVLTAVFLFPGNILRHIEQLLEDYNYAEVPYSSEEEEETGDSRANGTLNGYYIGKSSAPPEDSTTNCVVDRWKDHHKTHHGMLVLFQSENEREVLQLEKAAIDNYMDKSRCLNRSHRTGRTSTGKKDKSYVLYLCLDYKLPLVNLEKQSLSSTPKVGPLRQMAFSVLVSEINNIIRNPKPHQFDYGDTIVIKKLEVDEFELYLKGVDHKYGIKFDINPESTTIFRADILTTVTRDCIPKAAVKHTPDIATEERYAKSLIRALDYHYIFYEPTKKYKPLGGPVGNYTVLWIQYKCSCQETIRAPRSAQKKTPSTSTQGKGSKEKTGQDSPSTPQHTQKSKPQRLLQAQSPSKE